MKKSELIFAPFIRNPHFVSDINDVLNLPKKQLDLVLRTFLKSEYRRYYFIHINEFASILDLTDERKAFSILQIFDYLAYNVLPKFEIKDILIALDEIKLKEYDIKNINELLTTLKQQQTQEILKQSDLIDDNIGNVTPHFRKINYNIQKRIVFKNSKIVKELPIVELKFETFEGDNEIMIELCEDEIEVLINELKKIKAQFDYLSKTEK